MAKKAKENENKKNVSKKNRKNKSQNVKKDRQKVSQNKADSSSNRVAELKQKVAKLKQKNSQLDDQYLRAEAEMQNVQKHAAQDQANLMKYSGQKLAKSILPGLDNLQRALNVKISDKNGQQLKQGVQMVYKRLQKALAENNVKEVKVAGKPFDPQYAQAVQTVAADKKHPADQVVRVLQKGYQIHDRILRPAMVIVAK